MIAYISTHMKKHHTDPAKTDLGTRKPRKPRPSLSCLAKDCDDESPYSLGGTHYHSLVAGKLDSLELRNNYGSAKYDEATKMIVYPEKVPADRRPSNMRSVKVGAAVRE